MRYMRFILPVLAIFIVVAAGLWFYNEQKHRSEQNSFSDNNLPTQAQRSAIIASIPQQGSSGPNLYSQPNSDYQVITNPPPVNSKTIGSMVAHIQPAPVFGMRTLHPVVVGAPLQIFVPTVITGNLEIPTGCPAQFITAMVSDGHGGVWIADEDTGIYHGTPSSGRFPFIWTNYNAQNNPGLISDNIYSLCMDFQGRLWAGTLRDGICVFNGKQWANYNILTGPLGAHVFAIGCDPKDGSVWMCTENGISIYSTTENNWRYITRADGLPPNPDCLAFASDGTAYVGTQCDGLAISSSPYTQWWIVRGPDQLTTTPYGPGLPGNLINSIVIASNGTIYVATDEGLGISDDGGASFYYQHGRDYADKVKGLWHPPAKWKYPSPDVLNALLPEDHINCLSVDAANHLWLGTWRNGYEMLNIPEQTTYQVSYLDGSSAQVRNMNGYVNAILPLPNGNTLIGWCGNSITLIDSAENNINRLGNAAPMAVNTIPSMPSPAAVPTIKQLKDMVYPLQIATQQVKSIHFPWAASLRQDWTTQGDWTARYGREFALLCCGNFPGDSTVVAPNYGEDIYGMVGPHHSINEGVRVWYESLDTDSPKSLYIPQFGYRRQTNWDDHGEAYPVTFQGPDIWVKVNLLNPGIYRLSLYFVNQDGHSGSDRNRDYKVGIYAVQNGIAQYLQIPLLMSRAFARNPQALAWVNSAMRTAPLAQQRVANFWNPVYIRFAVAGPGEYMVHIDRNYSLNTELAGVFVDNADAPRTQFDDQAMVGFGGINYQPPEVPQQYLQQNPAFFSAWSAAQNAFGPAGFGLRDQAQVLAYRYASDHQVQTALQERWRWELDVWTSQDRQEFDDTMNKGFLAFLDSWPGLKQWMQKNHLWMLNSGELGHG
ncbi:MAG TPA: two-component regulator propeller domain-containing protein [Phycisphaerae bacterium]|nr:two-component regulator propeller domain-containing protein [Phycisphaerae bacterium]